jgi:hypothetical protein
MSLPTVYGRDLELGQLRNLLSHGQSFLLHGPVGVGKTLLLKTLVTEFPNMLHCEDSSSSQAVFRRLALELLAKKSRCVVQACGRSGEAIIKDKSAVAIRGIVTESLAEASYWIVLDHLNSPSQSFASALRDVCNRTASRLIAAARSAHMEDVGFLLPLFSDRSEKYALRNFNSATAQSFALRTAQAMQLDAANRDEAIEEIVRYSKGNPGAILAMLQMAANPKYVAHQHVKLSPLYIDFRLRWGAPHG